MMDTPASKITYDSKVTAKSNFTVHMSANSTGVEKINSTHSIFSFENKIKMPSYLIAIAVGDLA
jgi:leukotriene-A4 hydrolase